MNSRIQNFNKFSPKQRQVLLWGISNAGKDSPAALIAHGAVRSGKTFAMSLGFVFWSMGCFDKKSFAVCGKTIRSVRRNLVGPLLTSLRNLGVFHVEDCLSKNYFELSSDGICNRYYLFGGKDLSSTPLIQGITLAGLLMDEAALMPRSFVEQAVARCSVEGSKLWFNCNPESPYHWFKKEWIDKAEEKGCQVVHFTMDDNPSLSQAVKDRYKRLYSGTFYRRFVLGEWCAAQGLVYPMFSEREHCFALPPESGFSEFVISLDYGTVNPTSAGLWGENSGKWYRMAEYYYDSRREGKLRTDEEHYAAVSDLARTASAYGGKVKRLVCDPSAASFMECVRRHGEFAAIPAKNDVVSGIRRVSDALLSGKIKISLNCKDSLREFSLYRWDDSRGSDSPVKENDHAMDDIRYFASSILNKDGSDGFCAVSVSR